jgi:hypothetical protein
MTGFSDVNIPDQLSLKEPDCTHQTPHENFRQRIPDSRSEQVTAPPGTTLVLSENINIASANVSL